MQALGEQGAPPLGGHLPGVQEQPLAVGGGGGREPTKAKSKRDLNRGSERE